MKLLVIADREEPGLWDYYRPEKTAGIDLIICVGPISEKMQLGAKLSTDNDVRHFLNVDDCIHSLPDLLHEGDNILVKASHSMNFSKIVDFLNS